MAGDQLVVPRRVTHISCHYKNTIEGAGENRRTNEKIPQSNWNADILTRSSSLDPIFCWLASLLSRCQLPVSSFVQPTLFSLPVTTSGHAEISSPKPFVWFRAKTDKGIVCLAGHLHSVTTAHADGLSRLIPKSSEPLKETVIASLKEKELSEILVSTIRELLVTVEDKKKAPKTSEFIICVKRQMRRNEKKKKGRKVSLFSICDETVMYVDRVVMPRVLQKRKLKEIYMNYPGICRKKSLMRSYTYWPKMDQDTEKMIRECKGC